MAKYNLLEDDDLFDDDDIVPEKDVEAQSSVGALDETNDLDIEIDEDLLNIEAPEADVDSAFDINSDMSAAEEEPETNISEPSVLDGIPEQEQRSDPPMPESLSTATVMRKDFVDEKQGGLNYKPIIIGGVIIIAIILAIIGIKHYFFSGPSSSTADQETVIDNDVTPEQTADALTKQKAEKAKQQKLEFLNTIFSKNQNKGRLAGQVLNAMGGSAHLSSLLLYDQSFLFEVFGKTRDNIAKANIRLKSQAPQSRFNVVSSSVRPGSSGGVLSVFKGDVSTQNSAATVATTDKFKSISDLENALNSGAKTAGLKTVHLVNHLKSEKSGFQLFEVDADFSGSLKSCTNYISTLKSMPQIDIHKMRIIAKDQKTFNAKKYEISLILEVFI